MEKLMNNWKQIIMLLLLFVVVATGICTICDFINGDKEGLRFNLIYLVVLNIWTIVLGISIRLDDKDGKEQNES